jgi:acyl carrier protein
MASVEEKVIELIASKVGVDPKTITRETHFANDLGVDSLDITEMIIDFEEEFDIDIPEDAATIINVGQVITLVEEEIAE